MPKAGTRIPPKLLRDLRKVYSQPASDDCTDQQRLLRQVAVADPVGFVDRLQKAEAAWRPAKATVPVPVARRESAPPKAVEAEVDEGEERVLELVDRLLAGFEAKP